MSGYCEDCGNRNHCECEPVKQHIRKLEADNKILTKALEIVIKDESGDLDFVIWSLKKELAKLKEQE